MVYDIIIGRNEVDKQQYGKEGTILIGRHYVKMGQTTSLSNNIYMDVSRSHIVFVCGKRGSGKCLTGDSLITLNNGLEVPIEYLKNNKDKVFGLDDNFKIKDFEKYEFYEREVSEILKIKLKSGREIKLTPEHPLLTIKGWKAANKLCVGSRIATPRRINCFSKRGIKDGKVKVLAYLLAEGHTKKNILFSNSDKDIIEDFGQSLKDIDPKIILHKFGRYCYKVSSKYCKRGVLKYNIIRGDKGRFKKGSSITHKKTNIRKFIEKHGLRGLSAVNKYIPNSIFTLSKDKLIIFINRLFSCDGSIYKPLRNKSYWEISYSSSSKKMINQVQSLLLRFGIVSKIREKNIKYDGKYFKSYELVLGGDHVINFIKEIGFFGEKKKKELVALKEMESIRRNPNIDVIPKEVWDIYKPKSWADVGKKMGYKVPKSIRSSIASGLSRQKLLQIAVADCNNRMKILARSDIFWDEIMLIEKIEGKFKVYDFTVPEVHNFIANNIIVHNSYTMGVIAEGISELPGELSENLAVVIFDTMGIYWTMKHSNKKDESILEEWKLKAKALNVQIYTPKGHYKDFKEEGIPTDFPLSINPAELSAADWCLTFGVELNSPIGVLIERTISKLKKQKYSIKDIITSIQKDTRVEQNVKDAAENRFINAQSWGLFSTDATPIDDLVKGGQVTVLDISCYTLIPGSEGIRALVIGLVSQKLFIERMIARKKEEYQDVKKATSFLSREEEQEKREKPLIWLIVDEAHEFLPNEGKTAASNALITILREGRQPGISLVLASQQPGKIHTDVMTQSDIVIAHRVTAEVDIEALGMLMQSYMREGLDKQLNYLPRVRGSGIIFDDVNERLYPMRVRPRFTWHGGEAPIAIHKKQKTFEL